MDLAEFALLVDEVREERPGWFGMPTDAPASAFELAAVEAELGVRLPVAYREFVSEFGGGEFVFMNIFAVGEGSEWNMVRINRIKEVPLDRFVGVSDDRTGGLYGFAVQDGVCADAVSYLDLTARSYEVVETRFSGFFDFVAAHGLRTGDA